MNFFFNLTCLFLFNEQWFCLFCERMVNCMSNLEETRPYNFWNWNKKMRPRRRKRSKKQFNFDDYDESDYTLESNSDWSGSSNNVNTPLVHSRDKCSNSVNKTVNLALCPKNAGLQIKISGDISICVIGNNGTRREIFRLVIICVQGLNIISLWRMMHFPMGNNNNLYLLNTNNTI